MTVAIPGGAAARPASPARTAGSPEAEVRFRPRTVTGESAFTLAGSAVAALGVAWLVYERILPFSGSCGTACCCCSTAPGRR
jgi:phosphate transport system permease protein